MILYVQTPAIPRSELHNLLIKTMINHLDKCNQFSEIRWFVNIDAIKTSKVKDGFYTWEDSEITKQNFINISKNSVSSSILDISDEHVENAPDSIFVEKQSIQERKHN